MILIATALTGALFTGGFATGHCPVSLGQDDNGDRVRLRHCRTVEVELPSNRSTGYSWRFKYNKMALRLVSREYVQAEPVMPGSGGTERAVFKVRTRGAAKL